MFLPTPFRQSAQAMNACTVLDPIKTTSKLLSIRDAECSSQPDFPKSFSVSELQDFTGPLTGGWPIFRGRCLSFSTELNGCVCLFLVGVACLLFHFQPTQQKSVWILSSFPWKMLYLLKSAQLVQQSSMLGTAISCWFAQVHMPICFWEM